VKKLLKFGLAAASAEFALGGTRRAGRIGMGAASLLLGKAALRTNTKKFKGYVVTTLQFSDHKILTFEMKMKDWTSFDEEIHVLTFPEADKEFHKIKDVLEDEVTVIREQFASLSKEDKKAATSRIKEVEETIQFQGKQHKKRGKIAKKRTSTSIWTKPKITILVVIVFLLIIAVT